MSGAEPAKHSETVQDTVQDTGQTSAQELARLEHEAAGGDAQAQTQLGRIRLMAGDAGAAKALLEQACAQGSLEAQHLLANLLYGDPQADHGKAGTLLLKAAEAGLADAQCQAGRMYLEGDRLKQDIELGVYWLQQACLQSHPEALFLMSQIYGKGEAVAKDEAKAKLFLEKSAEGGHAGAQFEMAASLLGCENPSSEQMKRGFAWLKQAAMQGVPLALYNMGVFVEHGLGGVKQDAAEAVRWYEDAAERGLPEAQCRLGRLCMDGAGLPRDEAKARQWYELACEKNFPEAQYALAILCLNGRGGPLDEARGVALLEAASEGGSEHAPYTLGLLYDQGRGVAKDEAKAFACFLNSAEAGFGEAQFETARRLAEGRGTGQDLAASQRWLTQACEGGHARACCVLGLDCQTGGAGMEMDFDKARAYFEKAASLGSGFAVCKLGEMAEQGQGMAPDKARALQLYQQAASMGEPLAHQTLGFLHMEGKSLPRDYAQARQHFEKACEAGFAESAYNLAALCQRGLGGPADSERALALFEQAAEAGLAEAHYNAGIMRWEGSGCAPDPDGAKAHMRAAAKLGMQDAQTALAKMEQAETTIAGQTPAAAQTGQTGQAGQAAQAPDPEMLARAREEAEAECARIAAWNEARSFGEDKAPFLPALEAISGAGIAQLAEMADHGDALASMALTLRHEAGAGVPKDAQKAQERLVAAAGQGLACAQQLLGAKLASQSEPDLQMARLWLSRAAEQGDPLAQAGPGAVLRDGQGGPADPGQAKAMLEAAAGFGLDGAQCELAKGLLSGDFGEADEAAAKGMLEALAGKDFAPALALLGEAALAEERFEDAFQWLGKAAARGDANALAEQGILLEEGRLGEPDPARAAECYSQAASKGSGKGAWRLARCLAQGIGVEADEKRAGELEQLARELGYAPDDAQPARKRKAAPAAGAGEQSPRPGFFARLFGKMFSGA